VDYESLSIEESVDTLGTCSLVLPYAEEFTAFGSLSVAVDGVEIFGGRIGSPTYSYGLDGTRTRIKGFDHTAKLMDYLTGYESYVDVSTGTFAANILGNTPFTANIGGSFGYDSPLWAADTSLDFLQLIYIDTALVYDPTASFEVNVEFQDGITGNAPQVQFRAMALNDSYAWLFWEDGAGNIYYDALDFSDATWKGATDSGVNTNTSDRWAVGYDGTYIYLFVEDAGGNTDLYRGSISGDGITFALRKDNVVGGWIQWAMTLDREGHLWIAYNNAVYQSEDGGSTWTNEGNTGGLPIKAMFIAEETGDIHVIVDDTVNNDLEHWLWDESLGTLTFQNKIDDLNAATTQVTGGVDSDYNIHLVWEDDFAGACDINYCRYDADAGTWGAVTLVEDHTESEPAGRQPTSGYTQACCDAAGNVYVYWHAETGGNGYLSYKLEGTWYNRVADDAVKISSTTTTKPFCPQGYQPNNNVGQGICYFFDGLNDLHCVVLGFNYLCLGEGVSTGTIQSNSITISGSAVRWGRMVAVGSSLDDTSWSVLDAGDDSVIVSGQKSRFDLDKAGVPASTTSIKLKAEFTSTDVRVTDIVLTEMVDALTLDVDYDTIYTAMEKWRKISGGEYYLDSSGVLHLVEERGTDRSSTVVLRNNLSESHLDVEPNIRVVELYVDWDSYANCVRVLGDGEPPTRAEAELIDQTQVDLYGEHWAVLRDPDLVAEGMAYTRAMDFLAKNSQVIRRVTVEFIDPTDAGGLGIGDYVTLSIRYKSRLGSDVTLDTVARIVSLSRSFSASGSSVRAELITEVRGRTLFNYLKSVDDALRWITG